MADEQRGRVLVVDDDPGVREMLCLALSAERYEVRSAEDGHSALAQLDGWDPCAILLDWMMPELDGAAFLTAWATDPRAATTPVVVLSAARWWPAEVTGLRPAAFVPKPFDLQKLLGLIDRLCSPPEPDGA
jgi:DNA-binding response OmpR family regulator